MSAFSTNPNNEFAKKNYDRIALMRLPFHCKCIELAILCCPNSYQVIITTCYICIDAEVFRALTVSGTHWQLTWWLNSTDHSGFGHALYTCHSTDSLYQVGLVASAVGVFGVFASICEICSYGLGTL